MPRFICWQEEDGEEYGSCKITASDHREAAELHRERSLGDGGSDCAHTICVRAEGANEYLVYVVTVDRVVTFDAGFTRRVVDP